MSSLCFFCFEHIRTIRANPPHLRPSVFYPATTARIHLKSPAGSPEKCTGKPYGGVIVPLKPKHVLCGMRLIGTDVVPIFRPTGMIQVYLQASSDTVERGYVQN